jgi:putative ABC transport system substrate-binding protein
MHFPWGSRMRRRDFVATVACGAVAWSLDARAQRSARPYRIGVLWHAASAEQEGPLYRALLEGFSNLGYVEGRDITFEHRFPNEMPERFRSMAAELVSLNVDVIVSSGNNASPYARNATATIPVVFMLVADPVATGMVESFARPGGNATGISNFASELIEKRLQILKDIVPHLSNVAMLVNPTAQISQLYIDVARSAATRLGVTLRTFEARSRGGNRASVQSNDVDRHAGGAHQR